LPILTEENHKADCIQPVNSPVRLYRDVPCSYCLNPAQSVVDITLVLEQCVPAITLLHLVIKQFLYTPWRRLGERRYSSYSFSTSALDGGGQRHAPAALLPQGKEPPVPIVQEAGWSPEQVWTQRMEEISFASAGDRTPIARSSSP
jgi:hypothetical protein